jgi:hypothetical protein
MSSVPSGNPVVVARYAGAVYGLAVDYDTQEFYANQGPLQLDAALNALYRNDFTWTSTDAFAANLIANLGITGEPAVSQAVAYVTGMLNATAPEVRGAAVAQMLNMFATMTTDPQYGTFAVAWNAKVGSALTYSANPNSATMIAFNDAASVVAAQGFTLTNGTDIATAHIFNAGMVYTPGGNDRIPSLQDEDKLTGTAATDDVLNATIGNFNDASSALITPTLSAIETLNAVFSNTDGSGLDLQDATGLTTVNVTRVNAGGATVLNMPATATTLSAAGSADFAPVTLTYRDAELAGDQTVDLTLSNVLATLLTVGAQNNVITQQIENLNLVVDSASYVQVLDTREDGVATTGQTINITADADFVLGFDADDDGNVIEHNTALLNGFGISSITVTGAGNVTLGEVGAADDIVGNAVVDSFTLDASALTGNLSANISNSAGDAQSTFTSGSGNDTLITGPAVFVPAPVPGFWTPGQALAGDVVTNGGNDSVTIGGALTATGSIASGDGNDAVVVAGQMAGSVAGGGSITLGAGDDTLVLGTINVTNLFTPVSMAEEATVSAGDGNDTVTLTGSMIGDTPLDTDDDLGSAIDMGAGDDAVVFDLTNQLAVGTLIGGSLAGGSGVNTLTVTGNATVTNVANFDPTAAPLTDAVTGFATLNLVSEQAYNAVLAAAINFIVPGTVLENDTDAGPNPQTADYTADLSEFTGVTTINLENQAGVTAVTENNSFEGDAAIYTLTNLAGTEAVTLTTVEAATGVAAARNVGGVTQAIIAADIAADATLNVGLADSTGAANTFAATLNGNGDVAVNDLAAGIYGQVTLPTQTNEIENLSLTIGGTTARSIILADSNFENTLTLAGSNTEAITVGGVVAAGNAVDLTNAVSASTITSTLTGVINLTVSDNEAHTITTASTGVGGAPVLTGSSDVVNMLNDTLTVADRINLGDGSANRIIVNDALRTAGADTDAVFKNISNVQVLELRGAAGNVSFDNDALATGINTVVLDLDFDGTADGAEAFVDLNIDAAFTRALSISMANESTLDIDNKGQWQSEHHHRRP